MPVEWKTAVAFPEPRTVELGWILAILSVLCCPSARGAGRSVLQVDSRRRSCPAGRRAIDTSKRWRRT